MHGEECVINQSLEELRNLRQAVESLSILGEARIKLAKQLIALQKKEELQKIEMEQLQFVTSIKLQKLILTLHHLTKYPITTITLAYNKIIEIEAEIDKKLHINEKILHLKIIQTLLDYKICEKYGLQHNFYFQELLPVIQCNHLFEKILEKTNEQYEMFFLGLIIEFIEKQDVQNYLEVYSLTLNYIKEKLEKLKRDLKSITHESIVKELLILLHLHLSYKLLKKHLKFQEHKSEQNIYVLLYDLDYAITQKFTIEYKKNYNKTKNQAINFSIIKIKGFIVDNKCEINFDNELLQTKKFKKTAQYRIKRSSGSLNQLKKKYSNEKVRSLKKVDQKRLQIKNEMFVPEKINFNKKLQHKIELKIQKNKLKINAQKNKSLISINSIKDIESKQTIKQSQGGIKMEFTMSKDEIDEHPRLNRPQSLSNVNKQEKLTYSSCMKNILTRNQQLEQMLCIRPSNLAKISFDNKKSQQERSSKLVISKRNRSRQSTNNRRISHNYSSIRTVDDKIEIINDFAKHNNSSLYVPPLIKKNIFKYFKTFLNYLLYLSKRSQMPYFKQLISLDPHKYYYLYANINKFVEVSEENLIFALKFIRNNKYLQNVSIDIKQIDLKDKIKSLFTFSKMKTHIFELFYFGKDIIMFKLNLKRPLFQQNNKKQGINQIKYEYEIYTYNIYLNTNNISRIMIKKIIKKQQQYMSRLNKQLDINFDYTEQIDNQQITPKKLIDSNFMKFYQFFREEELKYDHNLVLVQTLKKTIKFTKNFSIFIIKLYKCLDRQKYYLILESSPYSKLAIACKKIGIQSFFEGIRTISELKSAIIDQNKIYYECWNDVMLNKSILEPRLKKYCVRGQNGYKIYYSKILLDNQIKLVYGNEKDTRWYLIEPNWLRSLPNSRDRKFKSTKSMKFSRKEIKGQQVGIQLCLMEHFKSAKINPPEIYFNKENYHYSPYDHHWIFYQNQKLHFCFKNQRTINYFTIMKKKLMYMNSFKLKKAKTPEEIFQEFKNEIKTNYKVFNIVLLEFNLVVKVKCHKNEIVCSFSHDDMDHRIEIEKSQFTMFYQQNLEITDKILHHKTFQNRLIRIIKDKIYQLNYQRY